MLVYLRYRARAYVRFVLSLALTSTPDTVSFTWTSPPRGERAPRVGGSTLPEDQELLILLGSRWGDALPPDSSSSSLLLSA